MRHVACNGTGYTQAHTSQTTWTPNAPSLWSVAA